MERTGRFDPAPGVVGISPEEIPPLPDSIGREPGAGRLDPRRWFRRPDAPLEVEIGPGKGSFLLEHASRHPELNVLGIERAGEFWAYAADRVRRRGLTNVRLLHGDASDFLRWRCPDGIVRAIHLYYSDPWPKPRHHKHRVVQPRFLAECWRVLEPGGEVRIVTDHAGYWSWIRERIAACTGPGSATPFVERAFDPPEWVGEGGVVGTNYERKFAGAGGPHAVVLEKG